VEVTTYKNIYLFRQQIGKPCAYCKREMNVTNPDLLPTQDHVEPRSRGGYLTVWACWICNHVKRDMTLAEWRDYMAQNPEWWKRHAKPLRKLAPPIRHPVPPPTDRDWLWLSELMAWSRHMSIGCKEFFD
jgi:HNH endonuclease